MRAKRSLREYQNRVFVVFLFSALLLSGVITVFSAHMALRQVRREARTASSFVREDLKSLLENRSRGLDLFRGAESLKRHRQREFYGEFFHFLGELAPSRRVKTVFTGPSFEGFFLPPNLTDGFWHVSPFFSSRGMPSLVKASLREDGTLFVGALLVPDVFSVKTRGYNEGFWGAVVARSGEVFSSRNDRGFFPPGSLMPQALFEEDYTRHTVGGSSVETLVTPLVPGIVYVTGIWVDRVYRHSLWVGLGAGGFFLSVFVVVLLFFRWLFRRVSNDFLDLSRVFGHLDRSIRESSQPLDAIARMRYRYQHELDTSFSSFRESQSLVRAFSGMMESVANQGEELAALYEETSALQQELLYSNTELRQALEHLEELAHVSQAAVEARSPREAAETLIQSMTAFCKAQAGGIVLLEENIPQLMAFSGSPNHREELEGLLEKNPLSHYVESFEDGDCGWHVFPITYLGKLLGAVYLGENLRRSRDLREELHGVMAHFVPHVGGILRSRILVEEVHRSFHYMALRLQMISAAYHDETGEHLARIRSYSSFLGEKLGLDGAYLKDLGTYSMLHDIGKLKVPLHVLAKPGKLTHEEFRRVKLHTRYGVDILGDSSWLAMAREIALFHHERWDGSGYPQGLRGDQIPLSARIVGLADIYDALRSRRCYKEPFSHEKTCAIILEGDGRVEPKHFDPRLLEVFREHHEAFRKIYDSCSQDEERETKPL